MCSTNDSSILVDCHMSYASDFGMFSVYKDMLISLVPNTVLSVIATTFDNFEYNPWVFALLGSSVIGLSGIFPLLIIPVDDAENFKTTEGGSRTLKVLLSFAVGCLLGDVFLHLLPEIWTNEVNLGESHSALNKGLIVLMGLLLFTIVEKMFTFVEEDGDSKESQEKNKAAKKTARRVACSAEACMLEKRLKKKLYLNSNSTEKQNNNVDEDFRSCANFSNGLCQQIEDIGSVLCNGVKQDTKEQPIHVSGYLNLIANAFDNFTHGLAVGGSFLVSLPHGALTTFAILLHEIPHEVGDFAILLKSGFTRWDAAKAQIYTAGAGIVGSLTAIFLSGASNTVEARTSWIHPFTAGGFLHIALVTVLPDLLKEENPKDSLLQLGSLLFGIGVMAGLGLIIDE